MIVTLKDRIKENTQDVRLLTDTMAGLRAAEPIKAGPKEFDKNWDKGWNKDGR